MCRLLYAAATATAAQRAEIAEKVHKPPLVSVINFELKRV